MKYHASIEYELDFNVFHLKIYLIGYSTQGESVVAFLQDGDTVFYTVVVDSFIQKGAGAANLNKTIEIINEHDVKHVSMVCWTHPHHDHSAGLDDIIDQFCDDRTLFVFPHHIENNAGDIVELKDEDKDIIDRILAINRKKRISARPVDVGDNETRWIETVRLRDINGAEEDVEVNFYVMSPNAALLESYVNKSFCQPNHLSVSLLIDVNGYRFFLGGDLVDSHIERMDPSILATCRFVKIPHHGSDSAKALVGMLPSQDFDNACVSMYHGKGLPSDSILELYMNKCTHLYATGDVKKPIVPGGFGVIEYDYHLMSSPACYHTSVYGEVIKCK